MHTEGYLCVCIYIYIYIHTYIYSNIHTGVAMILESSTDFQRDMGMQELMVGVSHVCM
jgi:hypothetical protein